MAPVVLAFDIFGTVLNWRAGLERDLNSLGIPLTQRRFEAILASQERLEGQRYRSYAEVTRLSLQEVLGLPEATASRIALNLGRWPLFEDSAEGLARLMETTPCIAMTNSDRIHGEQVQGQLGFRLSHWVCAEDVRVYKPSPIFWRATAARTGARLDRSWWHVSAYADYDLDTARALGLTTVLVQRAHTRPGAADVIVRDLLELADVVAANQVAGDALVSCS